MKPFYLFLTALVSTVIAAPSPAPISEKSTQFEWKALEDDHGGFYVVWTETRGSSSTLKAQHIGVNAQPDWLPGGLPIGPSVQGKRLWSAFADGKGGLGLVWVEDGAVRAQVWNEEALPRWPSPVRVSLSSAPIETPVAVADAAGGLFVVWSQRQYTDRAVLLAQHVMPDGRLIWNAEGLRVSLRPSDQKNPRMIFDGVSGFHVAWTDERDHSTAVRLQRMNFQGFRLWGMEGPQIVSQGPVGPLSTSLQMAPAGNGAMRLAWAGTSQGKSQVYEQQLSAQGQVIAPSRLTPVDPSEKWNPVLWADGIGASWMGWEDARDLKSWQVYLRGPEGELSLAPSQSDQGRLAIAEDVGGGAWAVWVEKRTGKPGLYLQRVDAKGQRLLSSAGQALGTPLINPESPSIVPLLPEHIAILWVDQPKKGEWALGWAFYPPK